MRIVGFAILPAVLLLSAGGSDAAEGGSPNGPENSGDDIATPDDDINDIDDIRKGVASAMNEVTSLRADGTFVENGQAMTIDLAMAESGNCEGTMSLEGEGSVELIVVDGDGYMKPDEQFWREFGGSDADAIIDLIGDRWVTESGEMASVVDACNWEELAGEWGEENSDFIEVTGTGEVDGQETVIVTFESDEGSMGEAHVLASKPHYVVKMEVEQEGEITFSDFNEAVDPEIPTDVFDFADVQ